MYSCEQCKKVLDSPGKCFVRVTGWGKPNSKGKVDKLFGASAPHGYLCSECAFDMQNKVDKTESLF